MKGHERQPSDEAKKIKPVTLDAPYRYDMFAKNFKKKPLLADPGTHSSSNVAKHFDLYKRGDVKGSPGKSDIKNKTSRKRSLEKFGSNNRVTERISLNHASGQSVNLSTKSKMMKINSILCCKSQGSYREIMGSVEQRHTDYLALVKEWRQLGIFDEIDQLVMFLVEHYVSTVQNLMGDMCKKVSQQLKKSQQSLLSLQKENKKLRQEMEMMGRVDEFIMPVRQKLLQEYEKCQWSTFVLNSLAAHTFDLEGYIRELPLYKKWIAPILQQQELKKQRLREGKGLDISLGPLPSDLKIRSKSDFIMTARVQLDEMGYQ